MLITYSQAHVYQPLCFIRFLIPADGPRRPKHVVNKQWNLADCLVYTQEHSGMSALNITSIKTVKSTENVTKSKHLGKTLPDQNVIHEEITDRLH